MSWLLAKGLVIVESPAKAKTIQKYLGSGYDVEASLGHIKDLPKKSLGVDLDNDFSTEYVVIPGKEKVVAKLKKLAKTANAIYLAPDPDREGEAIAAHLAEELGGNRVDGKKTKKSAVIPIRRVTFNEITKRAVQEAFLHPRDIDTNLVDAQQTRRVLDRLVGYQISPLLWDKVRRGLSAGRVQTVALRLIVEREREIKAFVKEEYWTIDAHLQGPKPPAFDARFIGIGDEKTPIPNGEEAEKIKAALENADWAVRSVDTRERRRSPAAPFTTSKFQQDASRKLRFSVKRAMMIAQRLYEGVDLARRRRHGRPHHLHAYRLAPGVERRAGRGARVIGKDFGRRSSARIAQHLQIEEVRAGGPRSHPSNFGGAPSRPDEAVSSGRRVQGLQAHLAALCGLADESRSLRPDDRRYRRQIKDGRHRVPLPRDRFSAEVRRLPEGLRRVEGQQGRGR
jgi:5S rRNA maturation endonuclease (ribonuclease M5)